MVVLRALDSSLLPDAFSGYVALVNYVKGLHNDSPTLALSAHLVALASSVWNALVKTLSRLAISLPNYLPRDDLTHSFLIQPTCGTTGETRLANRVC